MPELLAWCGNVLFVLAAVTLAEKRRYAWIMQVVANVLYMWFAVLMGTPALFVLSLLLGGLSLRGYWRW